jgi:hypothetical protein
LSLSLMSSLHATPCARSSAQAAKKQNEGLRFMDAADRKRRTTHDLDPREP